MGALKLLLPQEPVSRYILRYRERGAAPTVEVPPESGVTVIDKTERMMLVQGPSSQVLDLAATLGWQVCKEEWHELPKLDRWR